MIASVNSNCTFYYLHKCEELLWIVQGKSVYWIEWNEQENRPIQDYRMNEVRYVILTIWLMFDECKNCKHKKNNCMLLDGLEQ